MKKDINEIKDKLRKLFAMMEEGNGASRGEVETAMKIARKLMAEYKLSKSDIIDVEKSDVINVKIDGIEFSTTVNPWTLSLLQVIAENFCCHPIVYRASGAKTRTAGLVGFGEDVEIAINVIRYAYNSIIAEYNEVCKIEQKRNARLAALMRVKYTPMTSKEKTSARNAFGNGYVEGVREAFIQQSIFERQMDGDSDNSFSLVMTIPKEVDDAVSKLNKSTFDSSNANSNARSFDEFAVRGYMAGKEFSYKNRIGG